MEIKRKNINRGYTKLRVWEHAVELFKISYELLHHLPYDLRKTASNLIDSANSILRNISEGYCRRNIKEYLNFLNIALGSTGELFSGIYSLKEIKIVTEEDFEKFDKIHYVTENELINLIKSLQLKEKDGTWETSFIKEDQEYYGE